MHWSLDPFFKYWYADFVYMEVQQIFQIWSYSRNLSLPTEVQQEGLTDFKIVTFHKYEEGNIFLHQWQLLERDRQKFCNSANQTFFHWGDKVRQDKRRLICSTQLFCFFYINLAWKFLRVFFVFQRNWWKVVRLIEVIAELPDMVSSGKGWQRKNPLMSL